jgi:hypothetical protein
MSITITGDPSRAIAAIAECQLAIDSLQGKTVKLDLVRIFKRLSGETEEQWRARLTKFLTDFPRVHEQIRKQMHAKPNDPDDTGGTKAAA